MSTDGTAGNPDPPHEGPQTTDSLLTALSTRAPQARERSEAARSLAGAIVAVAGLDAETAMTAETAAVLHEVGKLYIDRQLLPFPSLEASAGEREAYEQHFEHGRALADGAGLPKRVGAAILHSRERWDGDGPQGLGGDEIPIGARIVAIAREYVAAPALAKDPGADPRAIAATHLESLAGSILDPSLVAAAVKAIDPGRPS